VRSAGLRLVEWYEQQKRDLPWRRTRDPYAIWISEIMLQQTRVAAVIPYYAKFLARYPTVAALAESNEEELLRYWAGLGYYSRARNLHRASKEIAQRGSFPASSAELRQLPGIGDYTAAAIASIAFDEAVVVVDGNVLRVMSRMTNDAGNIANTAVRERLRLAAQGPMPTHAAAAYNQGLMELGATVCLPRQPQCLLCPWRDDCNGRAAGRQHELPIKLKKHKPIEEEIALVVVRRKDAILLGQRAQNSKRLAGFWELPRLEELSGRVRVGKPYGEFTHAIVNHRYRISVCAGELVGKAPSPWQWIHSAKLEELPLSTILKKSLQLAGKQHP
jgi:A/G-specific adenine glycosylase